MEELVTKDFCALQHEQLAKEVTELRAICQKTHDALFVGNGSPSKAILIDRHERVIGVLCWVVGLIATSITGAIVARLIGAI